ncbi:MAG: hypothetical protein WD424_00645 [Paenibacillaceae bacterium]
MSNKPKNVTFTLPVELIEKYRMYAKNNEITSVNAGVREALELYSVKVDKERLRNQMKNASEDPQFMSDLLKSMEDFQAIDDEVGRED